MKIVAVLVLSLQLLVPAFAAQRKSMQLTIQNDSLVLAWEPDGTFRLTSKKTGLTFLNSGKLEGQTAEAIRRATHDPTFGTGESLEVTTSAGNTHILMLFPNLPFALLRTVIYNGGGDTVILRSYSPVSFSLDLGKPASALRALGTAGLTRPDENPGSYVYFAVADPETRRGVVCGWITHDRGNGVVNSQVEKRQVQLDTRIDYGRLPVLGSQTARTETFAVGYFDDARIGLESWADIVAKIYQIKLRPQVTGYCTWYSKPNGGASDEQHIVELAEFAARELKPYGFGFVSEQDYRHLGRWSCRSF